MKSAFTKITLAVIS